MSANKLKGFTKIEDHGLLLLTGPDAHTFLQGQVTCDIDALSYTDEDQTCLGAHCTHKGRMLFSFRACQINSDTIGLSIYKELLPDALLALKKYSVFSKVEILNASEKFSIWGYIGEDTLALQEIFPHLPTSQNKVCHSDESSVISISPSRFECWIPNSSSISIQENNEIDPAVWTALDIADGLGEVRPETVEEFIPQMLNLQAVAEGISFNKGCYTGQEVVARMHYLGKLKRHMYRFCSNIDTEILPGSSLYTPDSNQAIGTVVISASTDTHQELLAVATNSAVESNKVFLDSDFHYELQALPLPYAINKE